MAIEVRAKKQVPTTLGKAPSGLNTEELDLAHLRKPIDTSLFGLKQILSLFETATDEVRRCIAYECELMFECRVCRTVFRSLANFILHKRTYCSDVYKSINSNNRTDIENNDIEILEKGTVSSDDKSDTEVTTPRYPKRNLSHVLKKLADKQECQKIAEDILNEELSEKADLEKNDKETKVNAVCLEKIEGNSEAVFQTTQYKQMGDEFMKTEVMEIHSILNTNEAVLSSDGKVIDFKNIDTNAVGNKLICTICNLKFATKKTLTHHIKYKHNDTRKLYVCPECKDTFANAWGVFRHLYKIHRKSTTQVRRIRPQIHSNTILRKQNVVKRSIAESLNENETQESELQACCGCGKRFERKAALQSHIQMCLKRVNVLNAKEKEKANQVKEKVNQDKEKTNKEKEKSNPENDLTKDNAPILRGASKRKPEVLKKIERQEQNITNEIEKEDIQNKSSIVENVAEIVTADKNSINDDVEKSPESNEKENDVILEVILDGKDQNVTDIPMNASSIEEDETLEFPRESIQINDDESSKSNDNAVLNDANAHCNEKDAENPITNEVINEAESNEDVIVIGIDYIEETAEQNIIRSEIEPDTSKLIQSSLKDNNIEISQVVNTNEVQDTVVIEEEVIDCDFEETDAVIFSGYDIGDEDFVATETNAVVTTENNAGLIVDDSNKGINNNGVVTTDAALSSNATNVVDLSEEAIYISDDSASCYCFDENSNDTATSLASNRATVSDDLPVQEMPYGKSPITLATYSRKRKKSDQSNEFHDETQTVFHQKCENYVNWNDNVCKPCSKTFSTKNELLNHMALHFNWLQYQCNKCSFMSYDKSTSLQHKCIENVRQEMIKYLTVRLPHWKTLSMATPFNLISDQNDAPVAEESVTGHDDKTEDNHPNLTCNKVNTQDPSVRKMIMEVIFGSQAADGKEPVVSNCSRPVRTRISNKNMQKDFVYDMKEVDSNKTRKKINESKVKPIKIVKNTEKNFHVINVNAGGCRKKKKPN